MIRRKGFRNQFILLHPFIKFQIGTRTAMLCIALLTCNLSLALFAMLMPILPHWTVSLHSLFQSLLTGGGEDFFGIVGDSNADGQGSTITAANAGALAAWNGSAFVNITTGSVANGDNTKGSIWQPFANLYYAYFKRKVLIYNGASGGSEFYPTVDNNNWYTSGDLYAPFVTEMQQAMASKGIGRPTAIFINLGLNDIRVASPNFTNISTGINSLISRLSSDFPGTPLVFLQVGQPEAMFDIVANTFQIRKLLVEACEANSNCYMGACPQTYNGISGSYNVDQFHYSQTMNVSMAGHLYQWCINPTYSKWARFIIATQFTLISTGRKNVIQNWVTGMGADYHKLIAFHSFKVVTSDDIRQDWTGLGLAAQNGAVVTPNSHVATNGTTQYIAIAYTPAHYSRSGSGQNNYQWGVKLRTVGTAAGTAAIMSGRESPVNVVTRIAQGSGGSPTNFTANATTTTNGTQADLVAATLYTVRRNGTTMSLYRNKTLDASSSTASTGNGTGAMIVGGYIDSTGTFMFGYQGTYEYCFAAPDTGFDYDNFYDVTEAMIAAW